MIDEELVASVVVSKYWDHEHFIGYEIIYSDEGNRKSYYCQDKASMQAKVRDLIRGI